MGSWNIWFIMENITNLAKNDILNAFEAYYFLQIVLGVPLVYQARLSNGVHKHIWRKVED